MKNSVKAAVFIFFVAISLPIQAQKSFFNAVSLLALLSAGDFLSKKNMYLLEKRDEILIKKISDEEKQKELDELRIKEFSLVPLFDHYAKHTAGKIGKFFNKPLDFSEQPWFNLVSMAIITDFVTGKYDFQMSGRKSIDVFVQKHGKEHKEALQTIVHEVSKGSCAEKRLEIVESLPTEALVSRTCVAEEAAEKARLLKEQFTQKYDTEEGKKDKFYGVRKRLYEALYGALITRSEGKRVSARCVCLQGSPGVGKTRFAEELAKGLSYEFYPISMGGGRSSSGHSALLKGSEAVYKSAEQGGIVKALQKMVANKKAGLVILLDEIDKTADPNGILDLLDSEQNTKFRDSFLGVPLDLSSVIFIATSNNFEKLETNVPFLANRMDKIEIPGYSKEEKKELIKRIIGDPQQKIFSANLIAFFNDNNNFIDKFIDETEADTDEGVRSLFAHLAQMQNMILFDNDITQGAIIERFKKEKKTEHEEQV